MNVQSNPGHTYRPDEPGYQDKHPVAYALRQAGYVPLPRFWIALEALPELKRITDRYRHEVNEIRGKVNASLGIEETQDYGPLPVGLTSDETDDPRFSKDAAWTAAEKLR